jgi:putative ATP-dependent endonuclease of OLD family
VARQKNSSLLPGKWSMTIESITLKNFQCYGDTPTAIRLSDLTALIGTNGAGKTAALQVLSRIFGATAGQRGLRRSDFHVPPRKKGEAPPASISLTIDLRLSFPELAPGHAAGAAVPPCFQHMAIEREGGDPFCRILLEGTWYASNLADGEIEEHLWWVSSTDDVPQKDEKTAFSSRERGLVHVLYVPATRDPEQEIRAASAALIGRLLNVIKWSKDVREEVAAASENLDDIITSEDAIATIQDRLEERWQSLHNDTLYAEPTMEFSVGELEDLLKRVQVVFGPTVGESHDHLDRLR